MILMNNNFFSLFAIFFLFSFLVCLIRLNLNYGPLFIYRLIVTPNWVLSIIFFIFFYVVFYLIANFTVEYTDNLILYTLDKDTTNVNIGENATVNVTTNGGQITLPVNHMNRVAASISATGGAAAGIQVAKYIGGPPAVKLAAGVATAGVVQLTTTFMAKVLDNNNNNNVNKLVANLTNSPNNTDILNNYPLNLLFEINGLLICALVFLYIIINIYISKYIINKNFINYIPQDNKIGKFLAFWLNKYLNLWSKSSNYLLGFCYLMLLFSIVICKIGLYIILS